MFDTANQIKIHIISCGIASEISSECQELVAQAQIIFGSRSLLADVAMRYNPSADHHPIAAQATANAAEAIDLARRGQHVVILASGDSLYHGFGGTLINSLNMLHNTICDNAEKLETLPELVFHPNITAFQQLFHTLGLPWSDAKLFSVHSGQNAISKTGGINKNVLPLRQLAENPLCVIYAGSRYTAADIAQALITFLPESLSRPAFLAEQLGTSHEHIVQATLEEVATMNSVPTSILLLMPHQSCHALPLPLGLPEEEYQRERNLITASDARAIILSRLRLPSQGLMWDMGAGSGSVGLEAAALRPQLEVVAVERKPERVDMVNGNACSLGIANHQCLCGEALPSIQNLQGMPNRIFIGGGGADLHAILDRCMERLAPDGLLLVSSVTTESFLALHQWHQEWRRDVTTISIARETSIAGHYHHMRHQNNISLFTFSK